jgi:predicted Rdx family selenoprotein
MIDSYRSAAMIELQDHWGDVFAIAVDEAGVWSASRRDDGTTHTAASAAELRQAIRIEYWHRPVIRP